MNKISGWRQTAIYSLALNKMHARYNTICCDKLNLSAIMEEGEKISQSSRLVIINQGLADSEIHHLMIVEHLRIKGVFYCIGLYVVVAM